MSDLLDQLAKEVADLQQTRDELKVKVHLAKADAKDEWARLEQRLGEAETKLKTLREQARQPAQDVAHEVADTAKAVVAELKEGFNKIRSHF